MTTKRRMSANDARNRLAAAQATVGGTGSLDLDDLDDDRGDSGRTHVATPGDMGLGSLDAPADDRAGGRPPTAVALAPESAANLGRTAGEGGRPRSLDLDDRGDSGQTRTATPGDADPAAFQERIAGEVEPSPPTAGVFTPPAELPGAQAEINDGTKYPTGLEVPPELHTQVQRAARKPGTDTVMRQTEVLLTAFETVYEDLPEIVSGHRNRKRVKSPLFGTRTVEVTEHHGAMKRLQVRPTWGQYKALQALAAHYELPLAVLTRLVLREYFQRRRPRSSGGPRKVEEG